MPALTELVKKDLHLRSRVSTELKLPVEIELFLFGRPLFIILDSLGIDVQDLDGDIQLNVRKS